MNPARFVTPLNTLFVVVVFAMAAGVTGATAQSTPQTGTGQQAESVIETEDRKLFKLYNTAYYAYLRRDFELARVKFRELLGKAKPGGAFAKTSRQYLSELEGPNRAQQTGGRQPDATRRASKAPDTRSVIRDRPIPLDARAPDSAYIEREVPRRENRRPSQEIPNYVRELLREHKNRTVQTGKKTGRKQVREDGSDQNLTNWRTRKSVRRSSSLPNRYRDRRIRRINNRFRNAVGDRFFFVAGADTLSLDDETQLQRQAIWLSQRPGIKITVVGHAADSGGERRNFDLSERRARTVRDTLLRYGVNAADVSIDARGDTQPIAMCTSRACDAQNRRVVLNIERIPSRKSMRNRRYGRTWQSQ